MTTTITSDDLLSRMTQEELDELTTTAIESDQADPVDQAVAGGLGEIKVSIDPDIIESVSAEMLYRVWLSLAVPLLYPRRAVVPQKHLDEQKWARDFLQRAADGKIGTLLEADGSGAGDWGSATQIKPRNRDAET